MKEGDTDNPILRWRASTIELVAYVVIAALAVNVLSSTMENVDTRYRLVIGIFLLGGVVARAMWKNWSASTVDVRFQGALMVRREDGAIVPIRGYEFAEKSSRLAKAAFLENEALRRQWGQHNSRSETYQFVDYPYRYTLLSELAEYLVLEKLATTVGDLLVDSGAKESDIKTLTRADIPGSVLANHFLDQFTRPLQDRPAFERPVEDNVVMVMGPDLYFHRFELNLPARSAITRSGDGILITHPLMECQVSAKAAEHAIPIPFPINPYLTPVTPEDEGTAIDIALQIRFNFRSFVARRRKLLLHSWATNFAQRVENDMSFARFVDRISLPVFEVFAIALESEGVIKRGPKVRAAMEREWDRRAEGLEWFSGARIHRHWLETAPADSSAQGSESGSRLPTSNSDPRQ